MQQGNIAELEEVDRHAISLKPGALFELLNHALGDFALVCFHFVSQGFPGIELVAREADGNADAVKGSFVVVPRHTFIDRRRDVLDQAVNRRRFPGRLMDHLRFQKNFNARIQRHASFKAGGRFAPDAVAEKCRARPRYVE